MQDLNISIKQEFKANDFTDDMKGKIYWSINKPKFNLTECCFLKRRKEIDSEYIISYIYDKYCKVIVEEISIIKLPAEHLVFFFDEIEAKSYYFDFLIKENKIENVSFFDNESNLELKNKYIQILNKTLLENEINKLKSEIEKHQLEIKEKIEKLKSYNQL